jgi:hypothetical protein
MVACSTGGQAPTAGKTPVPITPETSPLPLVIPPPTVPFVRCNTEDLDIQLVRVGVGLGNVGGVIEVRNRSSHDCDLYGYAAIQLLDARQRPVPTKLVHATSSYVFGVDLVEEVVGLPAGTVAVNPDRPIPGHAYIPVSWNEVQEPCIGAALFKLTPPGASDSLVIPTGSGDGVMTFCSGGQVIVNPTRAAFYQ